MKDLIIPGALATPSVQGNWRTGILTMAGDSYPENAKALYDEIIDWTQRYLEKSSQALALELKLHYLNTSSIKGMLDLCDLLEAAHRQGRSVKLTWYYHPENDRIPELAEDFKEDCTFPFVIQASED